MKKTALIAGATGLVGQQLLELLKDQTLYSKIKVLTRHQIDQGDPRVEQVVLADFDQLDQVKNHLQADDIYCCLGTTMNKAGSKQNFYQVDYVYPVKLAQLGQDNNAAKFLLVSAMGADKSSLFYYNRVKGEVEEAIKATSYQSVHIFRPSLLLGDRKEKRTGEDYAKKIMTSLSFAFKGPLKKYAPIQAKTVAYAMFDSARKNSKGIKIYESDQMLDFYK